ncbi:MAG: M23 family metallopeptidase, partial [Candidatus Gracilibacteria bacterium]
MNKNYMYEIVSTMACVLLLTGCQGNVSVKDIGVSSDGSEKQVEVAKDVVKDVEPKSDVPKIDASRKNCYKGDQGIPDGVCSIAYDSERVLEDGEYIYTLPYEAGTSHLVGQGYNSIFTHYGSLAYSLDWLMDEGTPILAAREGVVTEVKDNSNEGSPDPSYWNKANYVEVTHSDGTAAWYGHAKYKSAKVKVGDKVKVGQVLNLAGCTGYCSVP